MKEKERLFQKGRLFIPMNERVLAVSVGLILSGLAHGATGDGAVKDCRLKAVNEGAPFLYELVCASAGDSAEGEKNSKSPLRIQDPSETKDDKAGIPAGQIGDAQSDTNSMDATGDEENSPEADTSSPSGKAVAGDESGDSAKEDTAPDDAAPGDAPADDNNPSTGEESTDNAAAGDTATDDTKADDGAADDTATGDMPNDKPVDDKLATDGAKQQATDPSTAPGGDTEIFNTDIETQESAEGEEAMTAQKDLFNLGIGYQKTSDDYHAHTRSFSYRNHRREWFWPWQESVSHGLDWGLDISRSDGETGTTQFDAHHYQGSLGGYLTSGTYLQVQGGRHILDTDLGDRSITTHQVTAMFGLKQSFSLQLENNHDFIYTGGAVTGGITRQLTASDNIASFRWRPDPLLRIEGQGGYSKYEDGTADQNTARQASLSALYGISPGWPWVWAGLGAQVLSFHREVPDYWSPNRYTAYGLRFETSFPVFKRLSGSAAINLDRQGEDGVHGDGFDLKGGLQYQLYRNLYARIDLSKTKSIQKGSTWTSQNVFFTLSGPLF